MKKILAIVMVAIIAVMCTACGGLDMKKVKGEWTLSTINGQSYADYAASIGLEAYMCAMNWTINDKNIVSTNVDGTSIVESIVEFNVKSNGLEMLSNGKLWADALYDEKADTFSFSVKAGDVTYDYVLVRGTSSLTPSGTVPADEGGDASVDNGGEDYVDEGGDYAEDVGYAEDGGEDYAEDGYEEE